MAGRKTRKNDENSQNKEKTRFKGFINVYFNDAEREAVSKWVNERTLDHMNAITTMLDCGYKVSLSWDDWNNTYVGALTGKTTRTQYDGYCVTLSHDDVGKLINIMLYVVVELLVNFAVELPGDQDNHNW